MMEIEEIALFHSPLKEKFGLPRQSGLAPSLKGSIIFLPGHRNPDALKGLEGFSHIWLIWGFSANRHKSSSPLVRPPRLGGNQNVGVFASRSPYRPNPLGISAVKIESIELEAPQGPTIHVLGADLMDGTPIYDIKPYIRYSDCIPEAKSGFADSTPWKPLDILDQKNLLSVFGREENALREILLQDPRPRYQEEGREYGLLFEGRNVRFTVEGGVLIILEVE